MLGWRVGQDILCHTPSLLWLPCFHMKCPVYNKCLNMCTQLVNLQNFGIYPIDEGKPWKDFMQKSNMRRLDIERLTLARGGGILTV